MAETPFPYLQGRTLDLTCQDGSTVQASILRLFPSMTFSPVMVVNVHRSDKQEPEKAVLKLFDRRFGVTRRRVRVPEMVQHTAKAEAAWRDYVRSGKVPARTAYLAAEYAAPLPGFSEGVHREQPPREDDHGIAAQWEMNGEDEFKVYFDLSLGYANEVRAYEALSSIQGTMVPRILSSVTVEPDDEAPSDLEPKYFQIPGLLMQYIDGYPLSDLTTQVPSDLAAWEELTRAAVEVTKEVCRLGVVNYDCQPKNYIATRVNGRMVPMMVDFGWVGFKTDYKRADGEIDEDAYEQELESKDCPGKIARLMAKMIQNETGHKIQIK